MAYAKNKNPSYQSKKLSTRQKVKAIEKAKNSVPKKPRTSAAPKVSRKPKTATKRKCLRNSKYVEPTAVKRTILSIIILSMLVVVLAIFFQFIASPERIAKQNVETIAKDYYENYLYETIVSSNKIGTDHEEKPLDEIMEKYSRVGFSRITLRQLLLYDANKYPNAAASLSGYCDENMTSVQIFPEPPYKKSDYRVEYYYSCTF